MLSEDITAEIASGAERITKTINNFVKSDAFGKHSIKHNGGTATVY